MEKLIFEKLYVSMVMVCLLIVGLAMWGISEIQDDTTIAYEGECQVTGFAADGTEAIVMLNCDGREVSDSHKEMVVSVGNDDIKTLTCAVDNNGNASCEIGEE